jgi:hypothetical protein
MDWASGDQATLYTARSALSLKREPVRDQSLTVPSSPPDRSKLPSGFHLEEEEEEGREKEEKGGKEVRLTGKRQQEIKKSQTRRDSEKEEEERSWSAPCVPTHRRKKHRDKNNPTETNKHTTHNTQQQQAQNREDRERRRKQNRLQGGDSARVCSFKHFFYAIVFGDQLDGTYRRRSRTK